MPLEATGNVQIALQFNGECAAFMQRAEWTNQTDAMLPSLKTKAKEVFDSLGLLLPGISYQVTVVWGCGQVRLTNKNPITLVQIQMLQGLVRRANTDEAYIDFKIARSIASIQCMLDYDTRETMKSFNVPSPEPDAIRPLLPMALSSTPLPPPISSSSSDASRQWIPPVENAHESISTVGQSPQTLAEALTMEDVRGHIMRERDHLVQEIDARRSLEALLLFEWQSHQDAQTTLREGANMTLQSTLAALERERTQRQSVERHLQQEKASLQEERALREGAESSCRVLEAAFEAERRQREQAEAFLQSMEDSLDDFRSRNQSLETAGDFERVQREMAETMCVVEQARRERAEAAYEQERNARRRVETLLAEVRREQSHPFMVPALMDAFLKLVQMSDVVSRSLEDGNT